MTHMAHLAQVAQEAGGNTKPQLDKNKSRKWSFTLNNWTVEEYDTMAQAFRAKGWLFVLGKEVGASGTPHIQGYVEHKNAIRFDALRKLIPRAHLEKSRGSTKDNFVYCTKDEAFETNIVLTEDYQEKLEKYKKELYNDVSWKGWQQDILDLIETEPGRRTINWFWDKEGNTGKSFLTKYIHWKHNTIIVNGKQADVLNGIRLFIEEKQDSPKVVIVDIPRTNQDYVCYGTMEKIKDGLAYSGKYEGGTIDMLPTHLIVFANFEPDTTKMSEDRWNIVNTTR